MSKQANLVVIGIFVLGAFLLGVGGLIALGSGLLFKETQTRVLYFEGSVAGLQVGATVAFRGVKVGEVSDIKVNLRNDDLSLVIPVTVELDPKRVYEAGHQGQSAEVLQRLVERGLRARLDLQSIVTGMLYVNLDFYPETEAIYRGSSRDRSYEIPTLPSSFDQIKSMLDGLPLKQISDDLQAFIRSARTLMEDPKLTELLDEAKALFVETRTLINRVDAKVDPLTDDTQQFLQAASISLKKLEQTLVALNGVLGQADKSLAGVNATLLDPRSSVQVRLDLLLKELSDTARSLKNLSETLERRPDLLLRGR